MTDTETTVAPVVHDDTAEETSSPDATPTPANPLFSARYDIPGAPEASPDGSWLAYMQPTDAGGASLWLLPTDGGDGRKLDLPFVPVEDVNPDTGRIVRGPQWSPDGTRLAVTGLDADGERTRVWIVPTGLGEAVTNAAPADDDAPEAEPVEPETAEEDFESDLSADEQEERDAEEGDDESTDTAPEATTTGDRGDAAPIEAQPEAPYVLVEHDGSDRSPRWSPDGMLIAMTTTLDGRDVISLAPADTANGASLELLTWSPSNDREAVWSRDGRFLAFLRQRYEGAEFHDILCFSLDTGELQNLTGEKSPAVRHSLEWVPGRNLIAYVTRDGEWLSISVINADNKAGWTVTRESGDKTEPRFAISEARLVYIRTEGFTTVLCERSLHASSAVALDPGEGVVRYGRWLPGKRVAYGFSAPHKPFGFFVQDNLADADRTALTVPEGIPELRDDLPQPQPFEFSLGPDEQFSGLLYRTQGVSGRSPAIVYLPDGPLRARRGEFQLEEQALASTGIPVLAPVIHGSSGFGSAVEQDLTDLAGTEIESADLAEIARELRHEDGIDGSKLAIVGVGYGGTIALLTAGARPRAYSHVVAIDPISDWSTELANADVPWRDWIREHFGMPLTNADQYAVRTPLTYASVITCPVTLIQTADASESRRAQMASLCAELDDAGIPYTRIDSDAPRLAGTLEEASRELARGYFSGADHADIVGDIRAEDLA